MVKAKVMKAMQQQLEAKPAMDSQVKIWRNPRDVTAAKKFGQGKLQLSCCTPKVALLEKEPSESAASLVIGKAVLPPHGDFFVVLQSMASKTFTNPFWMMPASPDMDECNLELVLGTKVLNQKIGLGDQPVELPFLRNTSVVEADESLVLYRPNAKKPDVEELQLVKRRRTGPSAP